MMDRLAFSDDTVRNQQLSQWRMNWGKADETAVAAPAANPSHVQPTSPALAIAGGLAAATAMPAAFAPLATSVSGGAYAVSAASASQAYRDDGER